MPCTTRQTISQIAADEPVPGVSESAIDAAVKTAKPTLYIRTRPKMSPRRPNVTTRTAVHHQVAHQHPEQVADVARVERVEVDAAEDRRQADDHDRAVERGHERAEGRVRQRRPLVARGEGRPRPWEWRRLRASVPNLNVNVNVRGKRWGDRTARGVAATLARRRPASLCGYTEPA